MMMMSINGEAKCAAEPDPTDVTKQPAFGYLVFCGKNGPSKFPIDNFPIYFGQGQSCNIRVYRDGVQSQHLKLDIRLKSIHADGDQDDLDEKSTDYELYLRSFYAGPIMVNGVLIPIDTDIIMNNGDQILIADRKFILLFNRLQLCEIAKQKNLLCEQQQPKQQLNETEDPQDKSLLVDVPVVAAADSQRITSKLSRKKRRSSFSKNGICSFKRRSSKRLSGNLYPREEEQKQQQQEPLFDISASTTNASFHSCIDSTMPMMKMQQNDESKSNLDSITMEIDSISSSGTSNNAADKEILIDEKSNNFTLEISSGDESIGDIFNIESTPLPRDDAYSPSCSVTRFETPSDKTCIDQVPNDSSSRKIVSATNESRNDEEDALSKTIDIESEVSVSSNTTPHGNSQKFLQKTIQNSCIKRSPSYIVLKSAVSSSKRNGPLKSALKKTPKIGETNRQLTTQSTTCKESVSRSVKISKFTEERVCGRGAKLARKPSRLIPTKLFDGEIDDNDNETVIFGQNANISSTISENLKKMDTRSPSRIPIFDYSRKSPANTPTMMKDRSASKKATISLKSTEKTNSASSFNNKFFATKSKIPTTPKQLFSPKLVAAEQSTSSALKQSTSAEQSVLILEKSTSSSAQQLNQSLLEQSSLPNSDLSVIEKANSSSTQQLNQSSLPNSDLSMIEKTNSSSTQQINQSSLPNSDLSVAEKATSSSTQQINQSLFPNSDLSPAEQLDPSSFELTYSSVAEKSTSSPVEQQLNASPLEQSESSVVKKSTSSSAEQQLNASPLEQSEISAVEKSSTTSSVSTSKISILTNKNEAKTKSQTAAMPTTPKPANYVLHVDYAFKRMTQPKTPTADYESNIDFGIKKLCQPKTPAADYESNIDFGIKKLDQPKTPAADYVAHVDFGLKNLFRPSIESNERDDDLPAIRDLFHAKQTQPESAYETDKMAGIGKMFAERRHGATQSAPNYSLNVSSVAQFFATKDEEDDDHDGDHDGDIDEPKLPIKAEEKKPNEKDDEKVENRVKEENDKKINQQPIETTPIRSRDPDSKSIKKSKTKSKTANSTPIRVRLPRSAKKTRTSSAIASADICSSIVGDDLPQFEKKTIQEEEEQEEEGKEQVMKPEVENVFDDELADLASSGGNRTISEPQIANQPTNTDIIAQFAAAATSSLVTENMESDHQSPIVTEQEISKIENGHLKPTNSSVSANNPIGGDDEDDDDDELGELFRENLEKSTAPQSPRSQIENKSSIEEEQEKNDDLDVEEVEEEEVVVVVLRKTKRNRKVKNSDNVDENITENNNSLTGKSDDKKLRNARSKQQPPSRQSDAEKSGSKTPKSSRSRPARRGKVPAAAAAAKIEQIADDELEVEFQPPPPPPPVSPEINVPKKRGGGGRRKAAILPVTLPVLSSDFSEIESTPIKSKSNKKRGRPAAAAAAAAASSTSKINKVETTVSSSSVSSDHQLDGEDKENAENLLQPKKRTRANRGKATASATKVVEVVDESKDEEFDCEQEPQVASKRKVAPQPKSSKRKRAMIIEEEEEGEEQIEESKKSVDEDEEVVVVVQKDDEEEEIVSVMKPTRGRARGRKAAAVAVTKVVDEPKTTRSRRKAAKIDELAEEAGFITQNDVDKAAEQAAINRMMEKSENLDMLNDENFTARKQSTLTDLAAQRNRSAGNRGRRNNNKNNNSNNSTTNSDNHIDVLDLDEDDQELLRFITASAPATTSTTSSTKATGRAKRGRPAKKCNTAAEATTDAAAATTSEMNCQGISTRGVVRKRKLGRSVKDEEKLEIVQYED